MSAGGQKFSIAVIPDTQYLFDEERYDPQVLAKTFQWIVGQRSYCGATPDGYNTCHTFVGGGQRFLLLSLDWRASDATLAWAEAKLNEYHNVPTILTMHELVSSTTNLTNDAATLSDYGPTVWERLIKSHNQIFMTLNGHFWRAGRAVIKNLAGREA